MAKTPETPDPPAATPAAEAAATDAGVDVADVSGTGAEGKVLVSDVADHLAALQEETSGDRAQRVGEWEIAHRNALAAEAESQRAEIAAALAAEAEAEALA
jgi:2-oxoisovalerate dehydrogenase E2 component (dihydrolipoyl transacylase)